MIAKLINILKKPSTIIFALGSRHLLNFLPDEIYLKILFKAKLGTKLNLETPKTFNEKLQWLKIYQRDPKLTTYVDKYAVRDYVSETIGDEYLIPLIKSYSSVEEINWEELPDQFVLKCNHGSGTNIICNNKNNLNIKQEEKKLHKWLKTNWFWFAREWPYKNIKKKIVCEKYMVDESGKELKDYKIFCFNGEPKIIEVDFGLFTNHKRNIYDLEWNHLNVSLERPFDSTVEIKKPEKLEKIISLARELSKDIPFVRVDFYYINGEIFFGELTLFHGAGLNNIEPKSFDKLMGE